MRKESLKKDGNKNGTSEADAAFDALFQPNRRSSRGERDKSSSPSPLRQASSKNTDGGSSNNSSYHDPGAPAVDADDTTTTAPVGDSLASSKRTAEASTLGMPPSNKTKAARKSTHISYADDAQQSSDDSDSAAGADGVDKRPMTSSPSAATADTENESTDGVDAVVAPSSTTGDDNGTKEAKENGDDNDADEEAADADNYEVEDIVGHMLKRKRLHFLVRWKNYGPTDDTYEPESALNCPEIIERYRSLHPDAVELVKAPKPAKGKPGRKPKNAAAENGATTPEVYEVDEIVGHRIERKRNIFLIRWKGYTESDDTWEPEQTLSCPELLEKYRADHPDAEFAAPKASKSKKTLAAMSPVEREAKKRELAEKDYEVKAIVAKRSVCGRTQYLVRWKGYGTASNTWETDQNLNCPDLIARFESIEAARRLTSKRSAKEHVGVYGEYNEDVQSVDEVIPKKKQRGDPKKTAKQSAAAQEDYEVERIVDVRSDRNKKVYLVKWKGWPMTSNTWEPRASLNCDVLLKKFEEAHQSAAALAVITASSKKKKTETTTKTPLTKGARKSTASTPPASTPRGRGTSVGRASWGSAKSNNAARKLDGKSKIKTKATAVAPKSPAPRGGRSKAKIIALPLDPLASDDDDDVSLEYEDNDAAAAEPEWEVEKITDVKIQRDGSRDFLIRWKGCSASDDTWEPESNVDCPKLIKAFMSKHKTTATVKAPAKGGATGAKRGRPAKNKAK